MTIVSEHTPKNSRNTEAVLLVVALAVVVGCYAMVGIGSSPDRTLESGVWWYAAILAAILAGTHIVLRIVAPYADPLLLPIATVLNGVGIAMIHRIDIALERSTAPGQMANAAIGILLCVAVLWGLRRHQRLRGYTYISMVLAVLLLILPLMPVIGYGAYGAKIWIRIAGYSFQPGELTKIVLTVFFAGYLVTNREQLALAGPKVLGLRLPRARDMGPLMIVWMVSVGVLVLQRDLGTSLLFFGLFVAMLYVATQRGSWVLIALGLFFSAAFVAWTQFTHVQSRVENWLHAFDNEVIEKQGGSFQLVTGLFGMANGGLLGTGLGEGRPEITPLADSDYIYASLGEEIGLVGLFALLMLYMVFVERAFRTALGVRDGFGKLLASGLGFAVCLQLFVVVGGVTRVIPLTGLTAPFLAAGGSSLICNWLIVGLLLRVSDAARQPTSLTATPRVVPEGEHSGATSALAAVSAAARAHRHDTPVPGVDGPNLGGTGPDTSRLGTNAPNVGASEVADDDTPTSEIKQVPAKDQEGTP